MKTVPLPTTSWGRADRAHRKNRPARFEEPMTTGSKSTMSERLGRLEGAMRWMMWRIGDGPRRKTKRRGARAGSRPGLEESLRIIAESPLFDAAWYVARHPGVATSGFTPQEHYFRKGAQRGLWPSAGFDPAAYLAAHPDAAGENPVLHAHRTGRGAHAGPPGVAGAETLDGFPIVARPAGEPDRRRTGSAPHEGMADALAVAREAGGEVLAAFGRLAGLSLPSGPDGAGDACLDAEAIHAAGAWLRDGPCRIDDAWHVDGGTRLRLRLAGSEDGRRPRLLAAFQAETRADVAADAPDLVPVGEAVVGEGPVFVNLFLRDPLMPVLLLSRPASGAKAGEAEAAVLPFPSLLRGGLHHAEIAASVPRGTTVAEVLARSDAALEALLAPSPARFAVGRIEVAGTPVAGQKDPLAEGALTRWLATVFDVELGPAPMEPAPARVSSGVLLLPHGAIPTIAALVARHEGGGIRLGAFLVADPVTRAPRHAVAPSAAVAAIADLQPHGAEPLPLLAPDGAASGPVEGSTAFPLAIRFRAPAGAETSGAPAPAGGQRLKRPLDRTSLTRGDLLVLLFARDQDRTANLLEDLAAQTVADIAEIRLVPLRPDAVDGPAAEVAGRLGERCSVVEPVLPGLADRLAAARAAGGRHVLVVSDAVALPDPATLETLLVLVESEGVAAASCLVVEKGAGEDRSGTTFGSGGWFPTGISFMSAPAVTFGRPDTLGALPDATYPVAAAGPEIVLFRADALAALDGIAASPVGDAALLQIALANAAAGKAHLVTTAVRAICLDPLSRRDLPDPAGPGAIPPRRLAEIADAITTIREVKG